MAWKDYLLIIAFVELVFYINGLQYAGGPITGTLLQAIIDPEHITSSGFWIEILIFVGAVAAFGIAYSLIAKPSDTSIFLNVAGIATGGIFLSIGLGLIAIYVVLAGANPLIAAICIGPLMIMYLIATIEWLRGAIYN